MYYENEMTYLCTWEYIYYFKCYFGVMWVGFLFTLTFDME